MIYTATAKEAKQAIGFAKSQILTFARYAKRRDLLTALLDESKTYTTEQVDKIIEKFMKGR